MNELKGEKVESKPASMTPTSSKDMELKWKDTNELKGEKVESNLPA